MRWFAPLQENLHYNDQARFSVYWVFMASNCRQGRSETTRGPGENGNNNKKIQNILALSDPEAGDGGYKEGQYTASQTQLINFIRTEQPIYIQEGV